LALAVARYTIFPRLCSRIRIRSRDRIRTGFPMAQSLTANLKIETLLPLVLKFGGSISDTLLLEFA
jgi:hypothetical protein